MLPRGLLTNPDNRLMECCILEGCPNLPIAYIHGRGKAERGGGLLEDVAAVHCLELQVLGDICADEHSHEEAISHHELREAMIRGRRRERRDRGDGAGGVYGKRKYVIMREIVKIYRLFAVVVVPQRELHSHFPSVQLLMEVTMVKFSGVTSHILSIPDTNLQYFLERR